MNDHHCSRRHHRYDDRRRYHHWHKCYRQRYHHRHRRHHRPHYHQRSRHHCYRRHHHCERLVTDAQSATKYTKDTQSSKLKSCYDSPSIMTTEGKGT